MISAIKNWLLVVLLRQLKWPVAPKVFFALAEKTIVPTVDLAIIRVREGVPEVLLIQRPSSDPFFPGMWHFPGGIVMPGQTGLQAIAQRALKADADVLLAIEPECIMVRDVLMGPPGPHTSPRGQEVSRLYHYLLQGGDPAIVENNTRRFFALHQLPEQFMHHHIPGIELLRSIHSA